MTRYPLTSEIQRVGKAGYIELPTRLNDHQWFLDVTTLEFGHKWWFEFDEEKVSFCKKNKCFRKIC